MLVEEQIQVRRERTQPSAGIEPLKHAVANLVRADPETNRPVLAFPLPETLTAERISDAVGGLLSRLARG